MIADSVEALASGLRAIGAPGRAEHERRYLKSDLAFLGASVPHVRAAVRGLARQHPGLEREALLDMVDALWRRPIHELRLAAVLLLAHSVKLLAADDLSRVERMLREARTWALVDVLAVDVVGRLLLIHPSAGAWLDRWAGDTDFWLRRAALLAHLPRLRAGGDLAGFGAYAEAMLDEREFFIRKAIGWVLREAGRARPAAVVAWLETRTSRASGVTMREAIKYLPEPDAARLMAAHRAGGRSRTRSG